MSVFYMSVFSMSAFSMSVFSMSVFSMSVSACQCQCRCQCFPDNHLSGSPAKSGPVTSTLDNRFPFIFVY